MSDLEPIQTSPPVKRIGRRQALKIIGLTTAGAALTLAGCAPSAPAPTASRTSENPLPNNEAGSDKEKFTNEVIDLIPNESDLMTWPWFREKGKTELYVSIPYLIEQALSGEDNRDEKIRQSLQFSAVLAKRKTGDKIELVSPPRWDWGEEDENEYKWKFNPFANKPEGEGNLGLGCGHT